jgi:hypothetical protein
MAMKEEDDHHSIPVRRDRCQCEKGVQIGQGGLSRCRSRISMGVEGNSLAVGYPCLPPEAVVKNTQKQYHIQKALPGGN